MTKKQIEDYLLKNPVNRLEKSPYSKAATDLKVSKEEVRYVWRYMRRKGVAEKEQPLTTNKQSGGSYKRVGDVLEISKSINSEIKNEKDLIRECGIDVNNWSITNWECKRYNAWIKNKEGEIEQKPLYSIYAKLKERKIDSDIFKQKEELIKELFAAAPKIDKFVRKDEGVLKDCLYEISIPDAHFGKLAWEDEVGLNYDLKEACKRFTDAVNDLLTRVNLDRVDRILFPIGNDLINVDGNTNTTTGGTPQSVDGRFPKIIRVVKELLIKTINYLSSIAPVDVLIVPGNHDEQTTFMIGEILDAYYSKSEDVSIQNSPTHRKYYEYGLNGFMYTHGDNEKHTELGLLFATERPDLWARTVYRVCKLGHFHKTKKISYVSVDENPGFQVEILPSISGTDLWHKKKGYDSVKAAKSFLYHRQKGKLGEFTYIV